MALYDKVRENMQKMQSGQLGGTSSEELKKQADAAGRMAPPVTPLEGSALGASPDAAKMAGTPNNKLNALQQSFRQETDKIQTTLRQQQARTQATEAEAAKKERAKQLEANLAGAPERLQKVAREAFNKATNPTANLALDATRFEATLPAGLDPAKKTAVAALADKAVKGTAKVEEFAQLEEALGTEVTADLIKKWYPDLPESAAASIAASLPNNVTADQLYQTPEQLQAAAAALGVTPDALTTMTFKQIKDRTQAIQAEEFSKTERLRRNAVDPNISPAERAAARSALKDQGAIGLSSTERDVASLEDRIANGDKVTFDGKQMDIEEMLSDDFLKGTIKNALSDPAALEALKKSEPDLAKLIETNKASLEAQMTDVDDELVQYAAIQKANKELGKESGLTSDVIKNLVPGFGKPSATPLTAPPMIQHLSDPKLDPTQKAKMGSALTRLAAEPSLRAELATITPEQFLALGMDNEENVTRALANLQDSKTLSLYSPDTMTVGQLNSMLDTDLKDLDANLMSLWSQAAISDPTSELNRFLAIVDSNRDGKVDAPGSVATAAAKHLGGITSLKDAINAGRGINDPKIQPTQLAKDFKDILFKGDITPAEKETLGKTKSVEQLEALDQATSGKYGLASAIHSSASKAATERVTSSVGQGWSNAISDAGQFGPGEMQNAAAADYAFKSILDDQSIPEITKSKVREQRDKAMAAKAQYQTEKKNTENSSKSAYDLVNNMSVNNAEQNGYRNTIRNLAHELAVIANMGQTKDLIAQRQRVEANIAKERKKYDDARARWAAALPVNRR